MPPRARRLLFRLGAFSLGLLAALVLGEAAVRSQFLTVEPKRRFEPVGPFRLDPELGYGHEPGYRGVWIEHTEVVPVTLNSDGMRSPEATPARLGAPVRVLCLGDSVMFGRGVGDADTVPARLEALLEERGVETAAFNAAVVGHGSWQERVLLERHLGRLRPTHVVVGWYRNDAAAVSESEEFRGATGELKIIDGQVVQDEEAYRAWRRRVEHQALWERSAFLRWLNIEARVVKQRLWGLARRARKFTDLTPEALEASQAELLRMKALSDAAGVPLALVVFPAQEEVEMPGVQAEYHAALARFAEGQGIRMVGLLEPWRAEFQRTHRTYYLPHDRCHLNREGCLDVARRLAALLEP